MAVAGSEFREFRLSPKFELAERGCRDVGPALQSRRYEGSARAADDVTGVSQDQSSFRAELPDHRAQADLQGQAPLSAIHPNQLD
jgi:hypothetical protein